MKMICKLPQSVKYFQCAFTVCMLKSCTGVDAQASSYQSGKTGALQSNAFSGTIFSITWVDCMWIILIIGLLYISYKMYSYKVALSEVQKANASMQQICNRVKSEMHSPLNQIMGELKSVMANAEHGEDQKQLLLIQQHLVRMKKLIDQHCETLEQLAKMERNKGGYGIEQMYQQVFVRPIGRPVSMNGQRRNIFSVMIPIDQQFYYPEKFSDDTVNPSVYAELCNHHPEKHLEEKPKKHATLFIIEDNSALLDFLVNNLQDAYRIEYAVSGEEGLAKVDDVMPDVVVCDLLLSGMDGFQVVSRLKHDTRTAHLPVIMLADVSSAEQKILEEETGACMVKPFDLTFLKIQLSKVTHQRIAVSDFYEDSERVSFHDRNYKINSLDKKLIEKFTSLMKEHMANEELNNDAIAGMLGLSRSLYYEKIKTLMGITPNEYLKNIRIREAARLLMEGDFAVAEVMMKVGFKDPKYFRDCFKKIYGRSPSAYIKQYHLSQYH